MLHIQAWVGKVYVELIHTMDSITCSLTHTNTGRMCYEPSIITVGKRGKKRWRRLPVFFSFQAPLPPAHFLYNIYKSRSVERKCETFCQAFLNFNRGQKLCSSWTERCSIAKIFWHFVLGRCDGSEFIGHKIYIMEAKTEGHWVDRVL